MDIRQIEYFRAVCETLNYTRAADKLHISQPSLSAAIQKLEGELGVRLLIRDNKKVLLTREGSVLFRQPLAHGSGRYCLRTSAGSIPKLSLSSRT